MEGYTVYEYARGNVNNPDRVYPVGHAKEGNQKHLAKDVEEAFPGKDFLVRCDGTMLCILAKDGLSAAEKITLDQVVTDHKNNA